MIVNMLNVVFYVLFPLLILIFDERIQVA